MMDAAAIAFPNLGIYLNNVPQTFSVFGFVVALYGIMIAVGMFSGFSLGAYMAKRAGLNPDLIWDFAVPAIFFSIIGARTYYVVMRWDTYKDNPVSVLYLRQGGLAIYGGVIAAFITMYVFTRIKKQSYFRFADQIICGLPLGQAIGRWGNFFNREAFGGYTNGPLAMQLPVAAVRAHDISEELAAHMDNTLKCIQVHPTFLYESMYNLMVVIVLVCCHRKKLFDGQLFFMYVLLYGIGRFFIESLRTDQLFVPGTNLPVSMVVAAVSVAAGVTGLTVLYKKNVNNK